MAYKEKMYAIVIVRSKTDKRMFGRVRRAPKGDVYAIWAEDESPDNAGMGGNPHASYHNDGRLYSKMSKRTAIRKMLQPPTRKFRGNQTIEVTNADRALSERLPCFEGQFDGIFEIPLDMLNGELSQMVAVDIVQANGSPATITGKDHVLCEKAFKDDVPWIVVRLIESTK